jgi:phosphoribosylaminoimidazolecarboxamide formyltransferase / IMP cyclohydrolase
MSTSRRALLSVSDKTGLAEFARGLVQLGFELVSTGGTAKVIRDAGLDVISVSSLTGFPEMMDGRVKTLHPAIHGALLARRGIDDAALAEHGFAPIELLAVNLYPFSQTIAREDATDVDAIENIDIGGPAMIRAAAKNHDRVTVVVDSADYAQVLSALAGGGPDHALRRTLAAKAYAHTAGYDAAISSYLATTPPGTGQTDNPPVAAGRKFPPTLLLTLTHGEILRYGENPHQSAAVYRFPGSDRGSLPAAHQHQGKALSFNNYADADAALECVRAIGGTAVVIVKHANPCGAAVGDSATDAYLKAYATDPTSAFGGVIAFSCKVDGQAARAITERQFAEVIVAPEYDEQALAVFAQKANIRVLQVETDAGADHMPALRSITGGVLVQDNDTGTVDPADLKTVTRRAPSAQEMSDLMFAWRVARYVKSNAIVYAGSGRTLGIGAGQMSRVMSARIGVIKAADEGLELNGCVLASDAFFPFRDGLDAAAEQGVRAVIQPGGSMRDDEVIKAADEHDIAMVFTGMRHFRH